MKSLVYTCFRMTLAAVTAGVFLAGGSGCATTSPCVCTTDEPGKPHSHELLRYRHMRHRHREPVYEGQRPMYPCGRCDDTSRENTEE